MWLVATVLGNTTPEAFAKSGKSKWEAGRQTGALSWQLEQGDRIQVSAPRACSEQGVKRMMSWTTKPLSVTKARSADDGPWAKYNSLTVLVDKVLLEQSQAHWLHRACGWLHTTATKMSSCETSHMGCTALNIDSLAFCRWSFSTSDSLPSFQECWLLTGHRWNTLSWRGLLCPGLQVLIGAVQIHCLVDER